MAAIIAAVIANSFEDMGCIIRLYNEYVITMTDIIIAETAKEYVAFSDDNEQIAFLNSLITQDAVAQAALAALALQEKRLLDNYIRGKLKSDIECVNNTPVSILTDLGRAMDTVATPQTIDACELSATGRVDEGNSGSLAVPGNITATRYFASQRIVLECIDITTVDSEVFSIKSTESGISFAENAVVAVAFTDSVYGLQFTIPTDGTPAVGDRLFIDIVNGDEGTFDKFFRDVYGVVLPGVTGAAETIDDALAE